MKILEYENGPYKIELRSIHIPHVLHPIDSITSTDNIRGSVTFYTKPGYIEDLVSLLKILGIHFNFYSS